MIVDDEQRMVDLICLYLTPHNYRCTKALSGKKAIESIGDESFDIVLLDVMMPEMDGWQTCEKIREISDVPIIMLTARDQKVDVVKGLKLGADDYITKPFDEEVLVARMEAVTRRTTKDHSSKITVSGLLWDGDRHIFAYQDQHIPLTPLEFEMMGIFIKNPRKVFSRDHLIQIVWGLDSETEGRTIDSHIRNIREKCRTAGFQIDQHLKTIWGVGYKWE
ncbi:response regulator transcription factor [Pseudalkalibacillus caeni]|uniref:Response regulator transcription factor n=1 Tax=Exobacillus caeni TaxID=2574798 RepID=A0A5R9F3J9_9BACL|nr:response regulator transcription factor [Pseudalkalibacillus caeni]